MDELDDDRAMTAFLLGRLTETERHVVLDRLAADDGFYEAMQAFEDELVMRWHRGTLSASEREQFERFYLSLPGSRAKVDEMGALSAEAHAIRAPLPTARWRRWGAVAAGAGLLAVLAGGLWRGGGLDADGVLAVMLSASGTRGAGVGPGMDLVRVRKGVRTVRLSVEMPSVAAEAVDVTVEDVDRGQRVRADAVGLSRRDQGLVVTVTVPAAGLPVGDYVLTIRRARDSGPPLAIQSFRVSRP